MKLIKKNILLIAVTLLLLPLYADARRVREDGRISVSAEDILDQISAVFAAVENPEVEIDMDERLVQVRELFLAYLESLEEVSGIFMRDVFGSIPKDATFLSIGTRFGAVPGKIDVSNLNPGLNIFPRQISWQGRALAVEFILADQEVKQIFSITMNEKGSGYLWSSRDGLTFAKDNNLDRPLSFSITRLRSLIDITNRDSTENRLRQLALSSEDGSIGNQWNMFGGLYLDNAMQELINARALWRLVSDINDSGLIAETDQIQPAVQFYERVNQLDYISAGNNGDPAIILPLEDYFTSTEYLAQSELLALAYEAKYSLLSEKPEGYEGCSAVLDGYIDILWQDSYVDLIQANPGLIDSVKLILKERIQLAIITKWGDTELRLSPNPMLNVEGDALGAMEYIYAKYGEVMRVPEEGNSYNAIYGANEENTVDNNGLSAPDRIFRKFAQRLIATIGAVYGVGGYFPSSESLETKDISITGEINDLCFMYLPYYGIESSVQEGEFESYRENNIRVLNRALRTFAKLIYGDFRWQHEIGLRIGELSFCLHDGEEISWKIPWMKEIYEQYFNAARELKTRGDI